MSDPDLRARVASLQRQVRVLPVLLVLSLVLGGLALWPPRRPPGAAPPVGEDEPGVLGAMSLYLRDNPDFPYVRLKNLGEGGGLILADNEGRGRALLIARAEGARLTLGSPP